MKYVECPLCKGKGKLELRRKRLEPFAVEFTCPACDGARHIVSIDINDKFAGEVLDDHVTLHNLHAVDLRMLRNPREISFREVIGLPKYTMLCRACFTPLVEVCGKYVPVLVDFREVVRRVIK